MEKKFSELDEAEKAAMFFKYTAWEIESRKPVTIVQHGFTLHFAQGNIIPISFEEWYNLTYGPPMVFSMHLIPKPKNKKS